ncbi:MAG: phosphatidylserine/phosphatidylglycerophosphate/cardiolipin synthase family protein [Gemmataceae bacterium]|nr:phosphatidylserine/phosphatidylglycerophosphate/cardiolipin synthase family protein [Gemmataceae bacterium]
MDFPVAQPGRLADLPSADRLPRVTVAGHELTLYVESPPLIASMVRDIRAARQRVWLESYIILNDAAGRAVSAALQERARAGLDVRVLYDAIGSQTTPAAFFRVLRRAGVKVHSYHSVGEAVASWSLLSILNRRDHRKLLVIDDQVGYFGGMNIVDQTQPRAVAETDQQPLSSGWRDMHVRLSGPQQIELAESFFRSWQRARGQRVKRRPRTYRQAELAGGPESIQFFDSGPGLKHTRAARIFGGLLRRAQHRVLVSMAYFLPVGLVLRELLRAHRRGVRIDVVVPGRSDVPVVQHATRFLYRYLLRRRFRIYERQLSMLHSKVMVVDDEWTVVGSSNLDARSLWTNLEFLAVIHSPRLAQTMADVIRHEIERSDRILLRDWRRLSWWQRLIDRAAWTLRWWL